MSMIIPTTQTVVARFVAGLYGAKLGNPSLNAILNDVQLASGTGGTGNAGVTNLSAVSGLNSVLNRYYAESFGSMTSAQVAATVVANVGIVAGANGLTAAHVATAQQAVVSSLNAAAPLGNQGVAIAGVLASFANTFTAATVNGVANVFASTAQAFNQNIAQSVTYSLSPLNVDNAAFNSAAVFELTGLSDRITGTAGNDLFNANFDQDGNTLQSGDVINGGTGGTDTLLAISGITPFAITPRITGVENIAISAQNDAAVDSGQNNVSGRDAVQIDFGRVSGVKQIWSLDSRSDLSVEDVRIQDNEITKDITIVMRDTDPGAIDYAVYFDQNSLRNVSNSTSTISLQVMDTRAVASGNANPLLNSPYGGFVFTATNTATGVAQVITLQSAAIDNAQTYAELRAAFQAAADANPAIGPGVLTVTLGNNFTVTDTTTAAAVTGTEINITTTGAFSFSTPAGSGFLANGVVPANSGLHTNFSTGGNTSNSLVTSTIILDNVGRGSNGGDLIIGGLSVGDTSTSQGVQRFDITVEDNSKLSNILSTNNTLREVYIVNGRTDEVSDAYVNNTTNSGASNAGYLIVGVNNDQDSGLNSGPQNQEDSPFGFNDVRVIDGSTMTGSLSFTAAMSETAIAKYVNRVDTASSPTADNIAVVYTGGTNNDNISLTIDGGVAASRSSIVSGQSDFVFTINGGAGNDAITVNVANSPVLVGGIQNWAANQDLNNNIAINGGAGNDTIRTPGAGDTIIDAGAGADVVYTDNTGLQTVANLRGAVGITTDTTTSTARWVFNTADQVNAVANNGARNLSDLRSDANTAYNFYKGTVTVNFKGIPNAVTVTLANATTYTTTDLEINQAIKQAINTDQTLNKLLIAQDGPANTLVVTSLIDGVMTTADLSVTFATAPASTVFSVAEIAGMATAFGNATITTSALALAAQVLPNATRSDYTTAFAQDSAGTNIVGAASTTTSDNFILPGTDNDVIVLGTTVGVDVARSSNEVITLAAGFGDDVVVNFAATGFGVDHFNVSALLSSAAPTVGALANTNNLITVVTEAAATNGNTALVQTLVRAAIDTAVQTTATKQLFVVVNATNVGTVYSVANGVAANDAVVVREGSIDLADTLWTSLTAANFTTVGAQAEGASSIGAVVPVIPVIPVIPGAGLNIAVNAATVPNPQTATALADTFTFASATYTYSIAGFAPGDKLVTFAGAALAVVPDANDTDGLQSFLATDPVTAAVVTINLTGLTNAQDLGLFNVPSVNAVFGAGSFV